MTTWKDGECGTASWDMAYRHFEFPCGWTVSKRTVVEAENIEAVVRAGHGAFHARLAAQPYYNAEDDSWWADVIPCSTCGGRVLNRPGATHLCGRTRWRVDPGPWQTTLITETAWQYRIPRDIERPRLIEQPT